jgi:trans-aconitate methyltransferase
MKWAHTIWDNIIPELLYRKKLKELRERDPIHVQQPQSVKQFYNNLPFPDPYKIEQLLMFGHSISNPYARLIESQIKNNQTVLDAGCGTGLLTNLLALRHPDSEFVGVDFSNSIDWAQTFSKQHDLKNANFIKEDLTKINLSQQFDVVICQGVLHHIPEYKTVLPLLKKLVKPDGKLILGLYHPAGKIVKKFFNVDYKSNTLFQDQELHPFEISFTSDQVKQLTQDLNFVQAYPCILNNFWLPAFFNYKNGGLVTYIFEKPYD